MSRVSFKYRIIVDISFLFSLQQEENESVFFPYLLRINQSSKENKKENVLILDEDLVTWRKINPSTKDHILGGIFCKLSKVVEPSLLENLNNDNDTKRILSAYFLASYLPFKIVILTTKKGKERHLSNPHYKENGSIKIMDFEESKKFILELFNIWKDQNESNC